MTGTLPNLVYDRGNDKVLAKSDVVLGPRTKHYEFGGPLGVLFVTIVSPLIVYALYFSCSEQAGGCPSLDHSALLASLGDAIMDLKWWQSLWDTKAILIYLGWYAFCVVSWMVLPGNWIEGAELRTGERKRYKMNGKCTV
jgi:Delta14-sterol reductase